MVMNPSTDAPDAAALAFGLGGREVAGRELQNWVQAALPGELGAIARGARSLGCAVSLVFLARTREADGERRGCQSPGVSCPVRLRHNYRGQTPWWARDTCPGIACSCEPRPPSR